MPRGMSRAVSTLFDLMWKYSLLGTFPVSLKFPNGNGTMGMVSLNHNTSPVVQGWFSLK